VVVGASVVADVSAGGRSAGTAWSVVLAGTVEEAVLGSAVVSSADEQAAIPIAAATRAAQVARAVRRDRTVRCEVLDTMLQAVGDTPTVASVPMELTALGTTVRHPLDHVEVFPAPEHVTLVTFRTEELSSVCPVTEQPDLSRVTIAYEPDRSCVESKSLKLYLWGFRDRAVFAEALAAEIAGEIMESARPLSVTVTLTQRPRGGIEVEAVARLVR
jgi:7-cyano-7-deazaguanine reductase